MARELREGDKEFLHGHAETYYRDHVSREAGAAEGYADWYVENFLEETTWPVHPEAVKEYNNTLAPAAQNAKKNPFHVCHAERCVICKKPFKEGDFVYDAATSMGWGTLDEGCFLSYGYGLGTGRGQKYLWGNEQKVEG